MKALEALKLSEQNMTLSHKVEAAIRESALQGHFGTTIDYLDELDKNRLYKLGYTVFKQEDVFGIYWGDARV